MVKWTYSIELEITCCVEEGVRYKPRRKTFTIAEDNITFDIRFDDWIKIYAKPGMDAAIAHYGDEKCKSLSPSLYLCEQNIIRVRSSATR